MDIPMYMILAIFGTLFFLSIEWLGMIIEWWTQ
jgi:hypothetical protein